MCYRASIHHFCDISGKQTACQTDYSLPGAARIAMVQGSWSSQGLCVVIGAVVWQYPLGLGKVGCEKSYKEGEMRHISEPLARAEQNSPDPRLYAVSAISVLQWRVCHRLMKDRCRTRVVTAEYRNKSHPTLFHTSCLSLCAWINLVGQRVSTGVDGITLFVTVVYCIFLTA